MNHLDLCLAVVYQGYVNHCITFDVESRKPLGIEAWCQRTTNRKWYMKYQMVTWPMTSRDPQRCCEAVRSAIPQTACCRL